MRDKCRGSPRPRLNSALKASARESRPPDTPGPTGSRGMMEESRAASKLATLHARLRAGPSPALRAEAAAAVGAELGAGTLSEKERAAALLIVERLASDVERQVREVLSQYVKSCPLLPPSTARMLAGDVESVALPFIQYSPALSDDDLVAIVRQGNPAKQLATAK